MFRNRSPGQTRFTYSITVKYIQLANRTGKQLQLKFTNMDPCQVLKIRHNQILFSFKNTENKTLSSFELRVNLNSVCMFLKITE